MNPEKIAEILASHALWLRSDGASGECANLTGADLAGVDLRWAILVWADLQDANLAGADLAGADLAGADLAGADLAGAILRGAILRGAILRGAILRGAILADADLRYANLGGADLGDANFQGVDLRYTNLQNANLQNANLQNANLQNALLRDANLDGAIFAENWQIVPQAGQSFTAFKKVRGEIVLELLIPGSAQRTSSLIGRKCRANEALVVGVAHGDANDTGIYKSLHCSDFTYEIGKMAFEPSFDPDVRVECTAGIHFFMTKEEAISYR